MRDVERATMEILREDLVNHVPALQQSITLLAAVVCHQKAMLVVIVERVTLAKDVTGAAMGGLASHNLRADPAIHATVTIMAV